MLQCFSYLPIMLLNFAYCAENYALIIIIIIIVSVMAVIVLCLLHPYLVSVLFLASSLHVNYFFRKFCITSNTNNHCILCSIIGNNLPVLFNSWCFPKYEFNSEHVQMTIGSIDTKVKLPDD